MKLIPLRSNQKGDTIVEVMLATIIMSAVLVTAFDLSNQASVNNQNGFERTQISSFMQEQAELLRVARSEAGPTWENIKNRGVGVFSDPTPPDQCEAANLSDSVPAVGSPNSYHMRVSGGSAELVNGVLGPFQGPDYFIWIDTVGNLEGGYNDFVINACWPGLSSDVNFRSGMVLRLEVV